MKPSADRPIFPNSYGVDREIQSDMLTWGEVERRLQIAHNYWIASSGADGHPHVAPVWGLWTDGAFYFSTDPASRKGRNITANPEVVVHLESGDDVVIVEGRIERV